MSMAAPQQQQPATVPPGTVMQILRYDSELLRKKSQPIAEGEFSLPEFKRFVQDMKATMRAYKGAGLSAIQCAVARRVIVVEAGVSGGDPTVLVNPVIQAVDSIEVADVEGCLSFPGAMAKRVERPRAVKVAFQDETGKVQTETFSGIQARAVCHEIDHLDGILLTDKLNAFERESFRKQMQKTSRLVNNFQKRMAQAGKVKTKAEKDAEQKAKRAKRRK